MPLSLVEAPVTEPISVADAKTQVLQGDVVDDSFLGNLAIPAARERCELATQRALITQTWDLILDRFPAENFIEIPKPPLVSVTYVKYYDTGGTLRTLTANTDYLVQAPAGARCRRGRIALPFSSTWPVTIDQMGAVLIRFVCGYGEPQDVPTLLKAGMLLHVADLYTNRESVIRGSVMELPGGVHEIYWSHRAPATQWRPD